MLAPERHQQILSLLESRGTLRTIDLAEEFKVTDETIRRDLQILSKGNQLMRVHGGASSLSGRPTLQSFTERTGVNISKKRAIAKAALAFVHPDQTYAFDSSTTAFALVSLLSDQDPYRIVTNAYAVLNRLVQFDNVDLISTGGRYHPKTQTFVGSDSIETLTRHNINTAFISCVGIDLERGISEGFEAQANFKEQMVGYAENVILLADSSKFNKRSDYFFAHLDQVNHIITDTDIDPDVAVAFRAAGCVITIAE